MPRGASVKREREYEKLTRDFRREGRYRGREEEVAARIVNKQRAEFGETLQAKAARRDQNTSGQHLPLENYEQLTIPRILAKLASLSRDQIKQIKRYETRHKNRTTLLTQLDRKLR